MLDEEICKVREMLNESIITGKNYKEIYELSVEVDELIAKYYFGSNDYSDEEETKRVNVGWEWNAKEKRLMR